MAPGLVEGTLVEGFKRLADLPRGLARTLFELFLRASVDGYLVTTNALTDSTDAERAGVRLELR